MFAKTLESIPTYAGNDYNQYQTLAPKCRFSCYNLDVSEQITITVDDDVAQVLRRIAAERDTTVNRLLHHALLSLVREARMRADRLNDLQRLYQAGRMPMARTGTR